jgi:hypothetical protein
LWRLPNLKELQVLYEAIGGKGGSTTAFTALDTYGYGVTYSASAMQSLFYWSNTERSSDSAYNFYFYNGYRNQDGKMGNYNVRCVRSL